MTGNPARVSAHRLRRARSCTRRLGCRRRPSSSGRIAAFSKALRMRRRCSLHPPQQATWRAAAYARRSGAARRRALQACHRGGARCRPQPTHRRGRRERSGARGRSDSAALVPMTLAARMLPEAHASVCRSLKCAKVDVEQRRACCGRCRCCRCRRRGRRWRRRQRHRGPRRCGAVRRRQRRRRLQARGCGAGRRRQRELHRRSSACAGGARRCASLLLARQALRRARRAAPRRAAASARADGAGTRQGGSRKQQGEPARAHAPARLR